jgi:hypothetical protein
VTSLSRLLSDQDRVRLLGRLRELRELDRLMREPGTLAGPRDGQDQDDATRPGSTGEPPRIRR